jgi:hypothetical protein
LIQKVANIVQTDLPTHTPEEPEKPKKVARKTITSAPAKKPEFPSSSHVIKPSFKKTKSGTK